MNFKQNKMKKNLLKGLLLGCSALVLLNGCVKDKYSSNQAAGIGPSYVRITEAEVYSQFFAPFLTVKPITVLSVRRDAASSDAAAATNVVALTDITANNVSQSSTAETYLAAFNRHNGTSYSAMPSTLYTFASASDASVTKTSTGYSFNFGPGDFAKNLTFNVDGSQVDLSKQYAIAFTITNTGGLTRKIGLDTIIATIAIKNKYDGVYAVTGTMVDVTTTTLTQINNFLSVGGAQYGAPAPQQYELRTTSANTCDVYDNYFYGAYAVAISSQAVGAAITYSSYGTFSPQLTFDLTTNKITAVTNRYGQAVPPANGRTGRLDPTGSLNDYESGTITIKYNMCQPSSVPVAPYVRTTWDETWKFLKSR